MTHTFVIVEISKDAFQDIKKQLMDAGWRHQIMEKEGIIDMHGLAIKARVKKHAR